MNSNFDRTTQDLLTSGLDDWVHLYEVHADVARDNPHAPTAEIQQKTLTLIRSLAEQGLFDIGDLGGPGGEFASWATSPDESVRQIAAAYIDHYDDESAWIWKFWLALTERGRRAAEALQSGTALAGRSDARKPIPSPTWKPHDCGMPSLLLHRQGDNPGTFTAAPPKAAEMYSPEVLGRGATDRLVIE